MRKYRLTRLLVPVLAAAALAGCSGDVEDGEAAGGSASSSSTDGGSGTAAATESTAAEEPDGAVKIPLGATGTATMPPASVLEIRVPAAWGVNADALRCTAADVSGRNEDLHSSEVKKKEEIGGQQWMTLWTFSAAPNTELTVGCADPENRVQAEGQPFVRVVARSSAPPADR